MPDRIVVIGMGRLGRTIVRSFGGMVTGVVTSRPAEARAIFPEGEFGLYGSLDQVPAESFDILWIAVPDRALEVVGADAAKVLEDWNEKSIVHSSGATSLAPLEPFKERAGAIAVLHPNAILGGEESFPTGLVWGITLDGLPQERIEELLVPFAPKFIHLSDSVRPLYHAAASVAANYSMTLFAAAQTLYRKAGVADHLSAEIVSRFMEEGIRVASTEGLIAGLTGPVARGDLTTVEGHLNAIRAQTPELLNLIIELIRTAVRLARKEELERWEKLLRNYECEV